MRCGRVSDIICAFVLFLLYLLFSDHHVTGKYAPCGANEYPTPKCPRACDANSTYTTPFAKDKHVFKSSYSIGSDPTQIQQEILTNGPVEAAFSVYADFESYKSGVYRHVTGDYLGGHAIKILGWGVDTTSKLPYWLVANSWNTDWGEQGFFRILRGQDECGIEDSIVAGKYVA
jgi:cathepsin B